LTSKQSEKCCLNSSRNELTKELHYRMCIGIWQKMYQGEEKTWRLMLLALHKESMLSINVAN
jgi:hypothetical protein